MNNVQKGIGRGASKQTAKRVAAQEALNNMGWIGGAISSPSSREEGLRILSLGTVYAFQPGQGYVQSPNVLASVAADKGLRLDWRIQKVGPDHIISWRAQCLSETTPVIIL